MGGLDIDTRSDIYSLGVLLVRAIDRQHAPGKRAAAGRGLHRGSAADQGGRAPQAEHPAGHDRGDRLDRGAAVDRAGEAGQTGARRPRLDRDEGARKDRTRRYESASGMARDIKRHLDGDPVEAGPPSALYRLHTFARKHRLALLTAAAVMTLLIVATVVSTWQAVRARRPSPRLP